MSYVLIRQLPSAESEPAVIRAHSTTLDTIIRAARAAGLYLHNDLGTPTATAMKHAAALSAYPVGWILDHHSGYRFRILKADYTDDGVPITPGLKVRTTDMWWGTVHPGQFMATGLTQPGGSAFDGYYHVSREDSEHLGNRYNGERLSTKEL